ncbi:hypothetical protein [Anaerotaenia torta]|uniref:hypothetical protein n=1 Tax=Anaerotaenia torta TaxID=433293 RepID=UPI003D1CFC6D
MPANDSELARIAWEEGADAVKVHINVSHRASKNHYASFEEEKQELLQILADAKGPCGIVAGCDVETVIQDYRNATEAGYSFVSLYAHDMPLCLLEDPSIVKMVAFDSSYDMAYLKNLEKLGADVFEASVMQPESYGTRLSMRELLQYADICGRTSLPVLVPTQRDIKPHEVGHLLACGVKATMIGAIVTGKTPDSVRKAVAEFRNAIDKL